MRGLRSSRICDGRPTRRGCPDLAQGFQQIAAAGGYTVADLSARFSNLLFRELFGGALG